MHDPISLEIFVALERGATVITEHHGVARTIHRVFNGAMKDEGRELWSPPNVLTVDHWLSSLWHRLLVDGAESNLLLNRTQEHALWREVIGADSAVSHIQSTDRLAVLAAGAWKTLCLFSGRGRLKEFEGSTDSRAFRRWAVEFERRCRRGGFITHVQLPTALEAALSRGQLAIAEGGIALVDAEMAVPAFLQFLAKIEYAGYQVQHLRTGTIVESAKLLDAPGRHEETTFAAHWAVEQLKTNPKARIAIVVPDLKDGPPELIRALEQAAPPNSLNTDAAWFSCAQGRPLNAFSHATAGFDLLQWMFEPLPLMKISQLLLTVFSGDPRGAHSSPSLASSLSVIAEFDAFEVQRIKALRPELSLPTMLELVEGSPRRTLLANLLESLRAMQKTALKNQMTPAVDTVVEPIRTYAEWSDAFRSVLHSAGWDRVGLHDPLAFQIQHRWEGALDEMATLDFQGKGATASEGLGVLARTLEEATLNPETKDAPVQILGPDEVGGASFDALWFLGADDLTWPPSPGASPFLPIELQRSLGVPAAVPDLAYRRAELLTDRIARSARHVVFSYCRQEDEPTRPSPLLRKLGLTVLPYNDPMAGRVPRGLTYVEDEQRLPALPDRVLRGGAQILQSQAACGFRAFAEWRLWSARPESRELGLDARERGSLAHVVMENFWEHVRDQPALREMPRSARESILRECIEAALSRQRTTHALPWDVAYLETQQRRLEDLLMAWLDLELARPHFRVRQRETQSAGMAIGPLKLTVRIDRIDETAGGLLILDYKTGPARPADWLSERPDAPQLPLYAVLSEPEQIGGVAFALLRAGEESGLKGFADEPSVLGDRSRMEAASIKEQIAEWRRVLTAIATAFAEGDADVAPKRYPHTCEHCAQRILCRIDPNNLDDTGIGQNMEAVEVGHGRRAEMHV